MNKNEFEVMKKTLSTGEFDGLTIRAVNTPRFMAELGGREIWLDGKRGLITNREDLSSDFVLQRLKKSLTTSNLGESLPAIGLDTATKQTESCSLYFNLSEYGRDTYTGFLRLPNLENHIAKDELAGQSPEALLGLEVTAQGRIRFNLVESEPCADKAGFDRVKHGNLVTVYLNSNTGEYLAIKTNACHAKYAPLAHLKWSEITDEDLLKALSFAPVAEIYQ